METGHVLPLHRNGPWGLRGPMVGWMGVRGWGFPGGERLLLVQEQVEAVTNLILHRLGEVPGAGRVLDQQDLASLDHPGLTVARGELHSSVEVDQVLASRGRAP